MTIEPVAIDVLLGFCVVTCWIGVIGMLRMREPTQALQYLTLPSTIGIGAVLIAVFLREGLNAISFKVLLVALVMLAINSVVTHATARAFRARALGHWQPRDGDPIEFVSSTHHPGPEKSA